MHKALAATVMALLLPACAGGNYVRGAQTAAPPQVPASAARTPQVMDQGGLDGVIGSHAAALTGRFGNPRIDLAEGDARKLQFAGSTCVLDIFLYPLEAGGTQIATHVEARMKQGGGEVDRASCIDAVEREAR